VGLVSLTRVWVPVVDLPFRYELFLCTRSVIPLSPNSQFLELDG
jgi:hypothetical protein